MGKARVMAAVGVLCVAFAAEAAPAVPTVPATQPKPAEAATRRANASLAQELPLADGQDFDDAHRGFIATLDSQVIPGASGKPVWQLKPYAFLDQPEPPATVNPSLWRHARLNLQNGLFKVTEGVYQVRGFDLANMTLVETKTGVIVIDPLTTVETAKAAFELYRQHRPNREVVAVVYTHSHIDHWGGARGVVRESDVEAGKVKIIAPAGFMEYAVSENVLLGNAMIRRSHFQFGSGLPVGERGQVDAGLGKAVALGTVSMVAPTDVVQKTLDKRVVDGLEIVFEMASGAEAPAEFHMFFPALGVLDVAETATHNLHNLLPLRGAEARDALAWSKYLGETLFLFGDKAEVLVAQHHWPTWGKQRIRKLLTEQRDAYKYLHDQTVRLMNRGHTPREIAEELKLPPSLEQAWNVRPLYGTVSHDAKAIYQRYLGWYDANPANLNPLPPVEAGKKYVEYMGGAAAVVRRARDDFRQGNYRWVAEAVSHVVFADPSNRDARELGADALEQLGYASESATWRNAYLLGARELREGLDRTRPSPTGSPDLLRAISTPMWFDKLGTLVDGPRANGKRIVINWDFTDVHERYVLNLENSALTYTSGTQSPAADLTLHLTRANLNRVILRQLTLADAMKSGEVRFEGDASKIGELMSLMDSFGLMFEVVEPRSPVVAGK